METKRSVFVALLVLIAVTGAVAHLRADEARTVVINEVAWAGSATSSNDEWIELYNSGPVAVDLSGWTLEAEDGSPSISLSGTIPAGGHLLLERTDDETVPGVTADVIYTGALEDGGEDLFLFDGASGEVDRLSCAASGWFAGHRDGRVPMVRIDAAAPGDQVDNWTHSPRCGSATNSFGRSRTCNPTIVHLDYDLDWAVYFNEHSGPDSQVTSEETPMEAALLALLDGADSSIDVALYGLNRVSVIEALIAAHDRGVTVRVVGDDEAALGAYSAGYQALTRAGVSVMTDAGSAIQHNKFAVIDGEVVWTGSTNLTDNGFTMNANNSLVITDTNLANVYTSEFQEMWDGDFHGDKADNTAHVFNYAGTRVESWFSPTDLVAFEVWEELADADESIHFGMFFWTDAMLSDRVMERMEDGVAMYGVWDQLGAANAWSVDEALIDAGAQIRIEDWPGKCHHKFAVIDVEGDDPTVILGSYNWTASGAYDNDENTLIIHDRDLARAYYAEWRRMWDELGTEIYLPLVTRQ